MKIQVSFILSDVKWVQDYVKGLHQVAKHNGLECVLPFEYCVDWFYHYPSVLNAELLHEVEVIFVQLGGVALSSTEDFTDNVL